MFPRLFYRFTVCARIDDDEFAYDLETLKFFLGSGDVIAKWLPAFGLAVLLRLITWKVHHQLVFPICTCFFFFFVGA